MRLVALVTALVFVAGCSSETGTPTPVKRGCDLFDEQALAKALGTTEPVTESPDKSGDICDIEIGAAPDVAAIVTTGADTERSGFAFWHRAVVDTGGVRDLAPASGDKAFVAPAPRPHEAMAGVLHGGTFYRISLVALKGDPVGTATAFVDVLEAGLSGS